MDSVIIVETGPAWWLVVLPALTGLAGAGLVAWWQGVQGRDHWRRDARIKAYSDLLARHHAFERALAEFARGTDWGDDQLAAQLIQLAEKMHEVAAAISMIEIVGPPAVLKIAQQLGRDVEAGFNASIEIQKEAVRFLVAIRSGQTELPNIGDSCFTPLRENRRAFTALVNALFKTAQ